MIEKIRNFRDWDVWKKGMEIVKNVYKLTCGFPKQELYGLAAHTQKSAISIPSNIAEGFNRFHNKEYKQFLYVALGSCAELETQIEIAFEVEYINCREKDILLEKIDHESRMRPLKNYRISQKNGLYDTIKHGTFSENRAIQRPRMLTNLIKKLN